MAGVPKDLPPRSTRFEYFDLWDYDGTLDRLHHSLYKQLSARFLLISEMLHLSLEKLI